MYFLPALLACRPRLKEMMLSDSKIPPSESNNEPETDSPEWAGSREQAMPAPQITSTDNLAQFFAAQRGELPPEQTSPPSQPRYQVSPAEPDWAEYTLPPVEPDAPVEERDSGWKTAWAIIREVGETILLTLIIFLLIQTVIRNFRVVGTSMVDNLHDGQYLIIDKLSYSPFLTNTFGLGGPQRGDVIVFEPPNRPGEDYVKRIIGLTGETVEIRDGQVFINNVPLAEPFLPGKISYTMPPRVVPEDMVFVMGDNRNNSNDSHNWGPLPIDNIVGRAWLSYWPPESWGVIPRDAPTETATLKHFLRDMVPGANAGSE
jgi:signal peptidase I